MARRSRPPSQRLRRRVETRCRALWHDCHCNRADLLIWLCNQGLIADSSLQMPQFSAAQYHGCCGADIHASNVTTIRPSPGQATEIGKATFLLFCNPRLKARSQAGAP